MSDLDPKPTADSMRDVSPVNEEGRLEELREQYEAEKATGESTGAIDAELIFDILLGFRSLRNRVVDVEQSVTDGATQVAALNARIDVLEAAAHRADVVVALPANAPVGYLMRLQGDASGVLYMGNGPTRALSRLVPVAL